MKSREVFLFFGCLLNLVCLAHDPVPSGGPAAQDSDYAPGFQVSILETFSHEGTVQFEGEAVASPSGQYLDNWITQLVTGYQFETPVSVRFVIPVIHRGFRRPAEGGAVDEGTESGVGDAVLLVHGEPFEFRNDGSSISVGLRGGLKLPTGSTERLKEELSEHEPEDGKEVSGIHGNELTLGSGSVDGIVGLEVEGTCGSFFGGVATEYIVRTEGDFEYQFADELSFSGHVGSLLVRCEDFSMALEGNIETSFLGKDTLRGVPMQDTSMRSIFMGPALLFNFCEQFSVFVGADLPLMQDNTALQIVTDYRIRGGGTVSF